SRAHRHHEHHRSGSGVRGASIDARERLARLCVPERFPLDIPVWFEVGSLVVLTLILIGDLLLILKRPHIPSTRESALWVVFYVSLALIFAVLLWIMGDDQHAIEFVSGWLTEYSLSIDNLFVFV